MTDIPIGSKWSENCSSEHIVVVTAVMDDFATCTMVAFESEVCLSSAPKDMFLKDFTRIEND